MPKTKEERAAYMKEYYAKNKAKMIDNAKTTYQNNKEERRAYIKQWQIDNPDKVKGYSQKPKTIKASRIRAWKKQGIRVPDDDWDTFYNYYLEVNNCNYCKVIMTYDSVTTRTQKNVHHDHEIEETSNFICICCHACNSERKLSNTSGEVNICIRKDKNTWDFEKTIDGVKHTKTYFKTKEEAIDYKVMFLSTFGLMN